MIGARTITEQQRERNELPQFLSPDGTHAVSEISFVTLAPEPGRDIQKYPNAIGYTFLRESDMMRNLAIEIKVDDPSAFPDELCDIICHSIEIGTTNGSTLTVLPLKLNNAVMRSRGLFNPDASSGSVLIPIAFDVTFPLRSLLYSSVQFKMKDLYGPKYAEAMKKHRKITIAKTMCSSYHHRLGIESPVSMLPQHLLRDIVGMCFDRNEEVPKPRKIRLARELVYVCPDMRNKLDESTMRGTYYTCYERCGDMTCESGQRFCEMRADTDVIPTVGFWFEVTGTNAIKSITMFRDNHRINKYNSHYLRVANWTRWGRKPPASHGWLFYPCGQVGYPIDLCAREFVFRFKLNEGCEVKCYREVRQYLMYNSGMIGTKWKH